MAGFLIGSRLALFFSEHSLHGLIQPRDDSFGEHLRLHALVDLNGLLGGIQDHETIGTFRDMRLDMFPQFDIYAVVEIVIQLLQKLLTGKQKRRPLSA